MNTSRSHFCKEYTTLVPARADFAISSRGNPFHAVAGPPYLAEGEIAVVRPRGKQGFKLIARVSPADWERLAR